MALTSTDKQVSSLIINKVPSEDVYQQMIAQNLVNDNEIYIVQDNDKTTIEPATAKPKANGTASVGTSLKYAREDHVHPAQEVPVKSVNGMTGAVVIPSDNTKADKDNPKFTGSIRFDQGYIAPLLGSNAGIQMQASGQTLSLSATKDSQVTVLLIGSAGTLSLVTPQGNSINLIKKMRKLTLSAANWSTSAKTYTATINGILADATKQSIEINPIAKADNDNAVKFGVYPTAQGANSITFSCDTIPTTAINFYITYQDVNYLM